MDKQTKKKIKTQNIVILTVSSLAALVIILGFAMEFRSPQGQAAEGINYDENYYQDIEQYVTPKDIDKQPLSPRRETATEDYQIASGKYQVRQEVPPSAKYTRLLEVGWEALKRITGIN